MDIFDEVPLTLTNIDSCFLFVPSQDPDLDVSLHQCLYGLRNFILELVLYCCGSQELQVLQQKKTKTKAIRGDYYRGRSLKRHVSEKHVTKAGHSVPHSLCFSAHQLLLFITQKKHSRLRGNGPVTQCVCASVDTAATPQALTQAQKKLLADFPSKLSGSLLLVVGPCGPNMGPRI